MLRRRILYKINNIDYSGVQIGDILCSDLTIVTTANYASSGKTAIGITYYNDSGDVRFMYINPLVQGSKA